MVLLTNLGLKHKVDLLRSTQVYTFLLTTFHRSDDNGYQTNRNDIYVNDNTTYPDDVKIHGATYNDENISQLFTVHEGLSIEPENSDVVKTKVVQVKPTTSQFSSSLELLQEET